MRRAEFEGTCPKCDHRITPGQWIAQEEFLSDAWSHIECPETPAERADREALAAGRCPVCGLNHPGEC